MNLNIRWSNFNRLTRSAKHFSERSSRKAYEGDFVGAGKMYKMAFERADEAQRNLNLFWSQNNGTIN